MDTTPSTITVMLGALANNTASFLGADEQGVTWDFALSAPYGTGAYWFTMTALSALDREGSVDFVSRYDESKDRWYVVLGNYGIPSEHFTDWREVHRA